jgi:NitT/TauT family transport system substrate-binding protein
MRPFGTVFGSLLALAAMAGAAAPARAETDTVTLGRQPGLPHFVMMVMQHDHLVEKHLAALGLPNTKVSWLVQNGGAQTDALLAGRLDFASFGVTNLATLWSASGGQVKAVAAEDALPNDLVTTDPNVKTIKDLTSADRIAVPTVGVSPQSIMLRMASQQAFGDPSHFNALEVAMSPADAALSLLSGSNTVNTHFSVPPFQEQELADPKVHNITTNYQILGGPATVVVIATTASFYNANPKTVQAVLAAEDDAIALIHNDPAQAAQIYLAESHDKKTPAAAIVKILQDPQVTYSRTPENISKFVDFMYKSGMIKRDPTSWSDLFFPAGQVNGGS